MKVYTYTRARANLASLLEEAKTEDVRIRRRNGDEFRVVPDSPTKSPFDVPSVKTQATTEDILEALRESRERF